MSPDIAKYHLGTKPLQLRSLGLNDLWGPPHELGGCPPQVSVMLSNRSHPGPTESPTRGSVLSRRDFPGVPGGKDVVQMGKPRQRMAKSPPGSGPPRGYFSCSAHFLPPPHPADSCLSLPSHASPSEEPRAPRTQSCSCTRTHGIVSPDGALGVPCAAVPGESYDLGDDGQVSTLHGPWRRRLRLLVHPRTHTAHHCAWHTEGA